jgi:hypothetical protein
MEPKLPVGCKLLSRPQYTLTITSLLLSAVDIFFDSEGSKEAFPKRKAMHYPQITS